MSPSTCGSIKVIQKHSNKSSDTIKNHSWFRLLDTFFLARIEEMGAKGEMQDTLQKSTHNFRAYL